LAATLGLRLPAVTPPDERRTRHAARRRGQSSATGNPPFTMMGEFRQVGRPRLVHAADLRLSTASLSVRL